MSITMGQLASKFSRAASRPIGSTEVRQFAQVGVGLVKLEILAMHAVDTGTMANSTKAERAGKDYYLIGPTVNYASYVALGTKHMKARPFHKTAAAKLRSQIKDLGFSAKRLGL